MALLYRSRWIAVVLLALAACAWATVVFQYVGGVSEDAPLAWWTSRGTGLLAYTAMAASMLLGLMVSWRGLSGPMDQRRIFALHDQLAIWTVLTTTVHIWAVIVLVVGGPAEYVVVAPVPATFGVLGTLGLGLLFASRWLTKRIAIERWRLLHRSAFLIFALSVGHAMTAAPGIIESPLRWLYALVGGLVAGAALFRWMFRHLGGVPVATPVALSDDPAIDAGYGWTDEAFVAELDRILTEAAGTGDQVVLVYVDSSMHVVGIESDLLNWTNRAADAVAAAVKRRDLVTRIGTAVVVIRKGRGVAGQLDPLRETVRNSVNEVSRDADRILVGAAAYPRDAWQGDGLYLAAQMAMYSDQIPDLKVA